MMTTSTLRHIAIIMDGNGRWAKERGLNRSKGHEAGADRVRTITKHCSLIDVKYLTLYAFSTENWQRPKFEVDFLMKLLERYFKNELKTYIENNIKFKAIGDLSKFSTKLQNVIQKTQEETASCTGMTQTLALNYGSRDEITRACKKVFDTGIEINEKNLADALDTSSFPDVDLLIRTSGELRISNFMLWQSAYAELFFSKSYWPDFSTDELEEIIKEYYQRERRFGKV